MSLPTRPLAPVSDLTLVTVAIMALIVGFVSGVTAPSFATAPYACEHAPMSAEPTDAECDGHVTGDSDSLSEPSDDVRSPGV